MKNALRRVLSCILCICLAYALVPSVFAADTGSEPSFKVYLEAEGQPYESGKDITLTLMLERTDSNAPDTYDLYGLQLDLAYPDTKLTYKGMEAGDSADLADQLRITTVDGMIPNYQQMRVIFYNQNSRIACTKKTALVKLTFTTGDNGEFTVSPFTGGKIYIVGHAGAIEPVAEPCDISIGTPAKTYKISFANGGATGGSGPAAIPDQKENDKFILPACSYSWEHHNFKGWSDGQKTYQPGDIYTMPADNVTFTAQWEQYEYLATFVGGDGTTGDAPDARWYEPGEGRLLPTENTLKKTGYTFEGWSYEGTTYKTTFTMPAKDVTFTAVWEKIDTPAPSPGGNGSGSGGVTSYLVTVNSPANGTAAADKKSAASGATVTITVTPETGYKVGTVTVKDKNGKTIAATEKDGKYSFQMPASAVSVDVTFVKDGQSSGVGDCPKDSTCPVDPFKDTANNAWWHDGIHYCVQQGLMNGVASDQFAPNGTTTRAMIVTILWRMEGSPATSYGMSFTDVPAGQWYTEAIRWAQSTGVVTGYDAKTFGPNDNVTREQLAAILYRYTAHKGGDVSKRSTLAQFTDVNQISSWALENIQWANAVGMVNGRTDTTIVPKGNATRAEAASMIQRFCQNVLKL